MSISLNGMFADAAANLASGRAPVYHSPTVSNYRSRQGRSYLDKATIEREQNVLKHEFRDINRDLLDVNSTSPMLKMTKDIVESHIMRIHYFKMEDIYKANRINDDFIPVAAKTMLMCHIVTNDGLLFTGESSCLDVRTFDESNTQYAYEKAFDKLYEYLATTYKSAYFRERAGI